MTLKDFLDTYDNWDGIVKVNDDNLNTIAKDNIITIMETRKDLYDKEVVAFGFYDGELTIRIVQIAMKTLQVDGNGGKLVSYVGCDFNNPSISIAYETSKGDQIDIAYVEIKGEDENKDIDVYI